jgi:hypothetical protein
MVKTEVELRRRVTSDKEGYYWIRAKDNAPDYEWEVMLFSGNKLFRAGYRSPLFQSDVREWGPKVEAPITIRLGQRREKKRMEQFVELAKEAGFSEEQAEFMYEHLAKRPHTHDVDEILGFDDAVAEAVEQAVGDDDDDEEVE